MTSIKSSLQSRSWRMGNFLVSTNPDLIPIQDLISIFDSKEFYWAKSLPPDAMQEMVRNSLCFGLYEHKQPLDASDPSAKKPKATFLGLARCVTDFVTFVYFTDVWVDPRRQGEGLGSWLVRCVQETIESMPDLRRSVLYTADWERSVPFYQKLMGMELVEVEKGKGLAVMERKGRGHPSYGREGTGYD